MCELIPRVKVYFCERDFLNIVTGTGECGEPKTSCSFQKPAPMGTAVLCGKDTRIPDLSTLRRFLRPGDCPDLAFTASIIDP